LRNGDCGVRIKAEGSVVVSAGRCPPRLIGCGCRGHGEGQIAGIGRAGRAVVSLRSPPDRKLGVVGRLDRRSPDLDDRAMVLSEGVGKRMVGGRRRQIRTGDGGLPRVLVLRIGPEITDPSSAMTPRACAAKLGRLASRLIVAHPVSRFATDSTVSLQGES
jgi:hypothetical protein